MLNNNNQQDFARQQVAKLIELQHTRRKQERDTLIADLRRLNRPTIFDILAEMLEAPNGEVRCDAAQALMRIDPAEGLPFVLTLLKDPVDYVRWCAGGLLHDFGDTRAVEPLIDTVLNDPDGSVRHVACHALERIGDSRALDVLRWVETHDHGTDRHGDPVSRIATEAIAAIMDRERGI